MKITKFMRTAFILILTALPMLGLQPAMAQNKKIVLALPDTTLSNSWYYVADSMGYWKNQGLDVEMPVLQGSAAAQALVAGDVQFSQGTGLSSLVFAVHHQPVIQIGSTTKTFNNEIVLSNATVQKLGISPTASTAEQRAKALKGLTIGAGQPNNNLDVFLKYVVATAGLDPSKDVTSANIDTPALVSAMEAGRIDGFSGVMPWPQVALAHKSGVLWISNPAGDVPGLQLGAATGINVRPDYCAKNADTCRAFLRGVIQADAYIASNPEQSMAIISPHFKGMDPGAFKASFELMQSLITPGLRFSDAMWQAAQKLDVATGQIKPEEQLTKFDGVTYTNQYLQ